MKVKIIFTALFVFVITHIDAQKSPLQKLVVKEFSIEHPIDWSPDTSGNIGSTFFLYSPLMGEEDTFSENINLIIQPLPDPKMTAEKYVDENLTQLPVYLTDYQLISLNKEKKRKKPCHILEYSGKMNGFELHFKQYIWIINGSVYLLTYTAEGKSFATYQEIATQMMESMKFK